ncbi:MAG: phage integrase Arm DNA-binding domain-containing protein [Candidatus Thiodiazotropha endolucinida]
MRPRKRTNRSLPPNLYISKKGSRYYFRYRNPMTGKEHSMGSNRAEAIKAAHQLNSQLAKHSDLVALVLDDDKTLSKWMDKFLEIKSNADLSSETIKAYRHKSKVVKAELGSLNINDITVEQIAAFLDRYPPAQSNAYRSFLKDAFKHAIAKGWCKSNTAEATLRKTNAVERQRLKIEEFNKILLHAPKPLQLAMRLALLTLQRRHDIANMQFRHIKEGYLYVVQHKTEKHGDAAHLRIKVTPQLKAVISECRDRVFSHYLIHQMKNRGLVKVGDPVSLSYLTKRFSRARDESRLFDKIPREQHPTFHEIRALGAHLYRKQGIDPGPLLGHSNPKTTKIYLDRHEVEWTEVVANLSL